MRRFFHRREKMVAIFRHIREAVQEGSIKPYDEDAPKKLMKYVPYWV